MTTPPPIIPGGQQPPVWQQPPTAPPKKNRTALVISLIIGIPTVIVVSLFTMSAVLSDRQQEPQEQTGTPYTINIRSCSGSDEIFEAEFEIRNNTARERDFVVAVEWTGANGARIATDTAFVRNLPAYETAIEKATAFGADVSAARCSVKVD